MRRKRRKNRKLIAALVVILLIISGLTALLSDEPTEETADTPHVETDDTEEEQKEEAETTVSSTFSILFIDVGQGDSALVECDGHYMLIDGGNREDSDLIYTVLKDRNIEHLDIVVATHADEDHAGGLAGALNYAKADLTLCSVQSYDSKAFGKFAEYAEKNGNGIVVPNVGDTYSLGSAEVVILAVNSDEESNETSIVLKIIYKETSFLFTGDAEEITEEFLLNSGADLSATVLKVGHHGSDSSTGEAFLKAVSPEYAVISAGKDNKYGHPTQTILNRLKSAEVVVFRTDLQGDVCCVSDGTTVTFEVEKNADADIFTAPVSEEKTQETETSAEPNVECGYVLNIHTEKFHLPDCGSVADMKEENKEYYSGTRQSVIDMGYSPCGRCNP